MGPSRARSSSIWLAAFVVFMLAVLAGLGYALDRQLRGGLLAQRSVAQARGDWVPLPGLPPHVPLAFLVVIDPTFLDRIPAETAIEGTTISRDLVRQVHRLSDGIRGDVRELVMGSVLEARLADDELLELYLNRVQLGVDDGWPVVGVYHAAHEYFGSEPADLTVGQAATLAGFLLPPRIRDARRQVGAVGIRRLEVLRQMRSAGAITGEEFEAAVQEPLGFQVGPEHAPMTRPPGWERPPDVIRLPPELVVPADTAP
jgi:membrane peptidoglycan carboxypeptidase